MYISKLDIEKTHPDYDANIERWQYYRMAYEGGEDFVKHVLYQNERESRYNYNQRLREAIYLNFPREIIDLLNFYLTEKEVARNFGTLSENPQWQMFKRDADGYGMDYDVFFNECQKLSSIYGAVGILVDKPASLAKNLAQEIAYGVYPYCSVYTLENIMDWEYRLDAQSGRKVLSYLKLREGEDQYYLWYLDRWERWIVEKDSRTGRRSQRLTARQAHTLGMIPFVSMVNLHNASNRFAGISDIVDIAYIAGSVVRDMSCGDEVIKQAGFPMLRIPEEEVRDGDEYDEGTGNSDAIVRVGAKAVHQFNPEYGGNAKPDWMPTEVLDPIDAILKWIDRKSDEIYRCCHLSGVHGQRKSNNEVASGLALRYEFQQLSAVLNKKAVNMNEAEYAVVKYWLAWQNLSDLFAQIEIRRARNFSIDELAMNLDNTIKAMSQVASTTFQRLASLKIVKQELPDISDKDYQLVEAEIGQGSTGDNLE